MNIDEPKSQLWITPTEVEGQFVAVQMVDAFRSDEATIDLAPFFPVCDCDAEMRHFERMTIEELSEEHAAYSRMDSMWLGILESISQVLQEADKLAGETASRFCITPLQYCNPDSVEDMFPSVSAPYPPPVTYWTIGGIDAPFILNGVKECLSKIRIAMDKPKPLRMLVSVVIQSWGRKVTQIATANLLVYREIEGFLLGLTHGKTETAKAKAEAKDAERKRIGAEAIAQERKDSQTAFFARLGEDVRNGLQRIENIFLAYKDSEAERRREYLRRLDSLAESDPAAYEIVKYWMEHGNEHGWKTAFAQQKGITRQAVSKQWRALQKKYPLARFGREAPEARPGTDGEREDEENGKE